MTIQDVAALAQIIMSGVVTAFMLSMWRSKRRQERHSREQSAKHEAQSKEFQANMLALARESIPKSCPKCGAAFRVRGDDVGVSIEMAEQPTTPPGRFDA